MLLTMLNVLYFYMIINIIIIIIIIIIVVVVVVDYPQFMNFTFAPVVRVNYLYHRCSKFERI